MEQEPRYLNSKNMGLIIPCKRLPDTPLPSLGFEGPEPPLDTLYFVD